MKNFIKLLGNLNQARSAKVPLLIVALVAAIGFAFVSCEEDQGEISGWATASLRGGVVEFSYISSGNNASDKCTITTDLTGEYAKFTLVSSSMQIINDLQPGQVVNWTATIEKGKLTNTGQSGNEVYLRGE